MELRSEITLNDRQCFTLGEWGDYLIEVMPMIYNDRLVMTPKSHPDGYDHGWCYDKGGAALVAALAWDPAIEPEPPGYKKRATPRVRRLEGS